jgi:acyl-CoA oxidase
MPVPGVEVGDVGSKMGYGTIDNGYLSFNQVRIPRKNMMQRFLHIKKDGSLELRGDPRLIY